jgi:hypothetical protein
MLRITPAISAIVLAVASSVVLAGKVDLVWKFKAGDEGDYVLARNRVAKLDLNGNEIEIGVSSTVDMHFVVKSVEGDKATLAIKMDRLQMNVNSPIEQVAYDSAGLIPGEESSLWPSIKGRVEKLVGSEAIVSITSKGNITEIKLPDDVIAALKEESPNPQVQRFMSGVFDTAGVKSLIKQAFVPLPEAASDVGTEWKTNEEIARPPFGKVLVDRTLTFVGEDEGSGGYENIAISTKVAFEQSEGENAEEISLEISEQEGKGNVEFDAETGRTREMEFSQTMKMDITFGGNDVVQNLTETTTLRQGKSDPFVATKKEEPKEEPAEPATK